MAEIAGSIDTFGIAFWAFIVFAVLFCCGFVESTLLALERIAWRVYRRILRRRYRGVKVTAEELRSLAS